MRTYGRTVATLALLLALGCAGALWSDAEGKALLPLSFGNAEFVNASTCVAGGPVSEGLVGLVGDMVRGALGIFTGRQAEQDDPSQDTLRQAGCLEGAPSVRTPSDEVAAEATTEP